MRFAQKILIGGAILLTPAFIQAQNDPGKQATDVAGRKPTIELVFVIDTTGSMQGLIDGAKEKVWSIVNEVIKSPSKPEVRMGLVAYRDRGDQYITQVTPITRDLDSVYNTLMAYKADGGGDTPEDVRQALADSIHKVGWSPRSPNIAQILFLVGDAPPHEDYANEPDTVASASEAVNAGILVNTIQCGNLAGTDLAWKKIARAGEGQYFSIAQDGGVVSIATPFDAELARLGTQVGDTYLAYGRGMTGGMMAGPAFRRSKTYAQRTVEAKIAKAATAQAQADRAYNKAINIAAYDENDLIQAVENESVKLEMLKADELPDDLQKLPPVERTKVVAAKIEERKKIRQQIIALNQRRDAFLVEARKRLAKTKIASFDEAVSAALKAQISRKGLKP